MFTDEKAIQLWRQLTSTPESRDLNSLVPLFAISVLQQWGWPVKPYETKTNPPPREQTFLGYFHDIGWTTDWWGQNFNPTEDELPEYWLPMKVLPIPYKQ